MSLATWIEARRLAMTVGGRFTLRIHNFVLFFLILSLTLLVAWLAFLGDYLPTGIFSFEHIVILTVFTFMFNGFVFRILLMASHMNEHTTH